MASNVQNPQPGANSRPVDSAEKTIVDLAMPYEEARQVVWPFRGLNAPIGDLVDQRRVDAQDLGFAMEKANDGVVRSAARTMLAYYLSLPQTIQTTTHNGPKIILGSRYLQDQERWSFAEMFFIFGVAAGAGIMLTIEFVQEWFKGTFTIPVLIVVVILLAVIVWQIYKESRRAYKEYQHYKRGRQGEDKVTERIQAHLDGRWTVFRNVLLSGRRDDIDFVLVGPAGVYALETKTYQETTRLNAITGRSGLRWLVPWGKHKDARLPDRQATSNAMRLKTLLNQRGQNITWVNAILVFAEYQPVDFIHTSDKTEVWNSANLDMNLERLNSAFAKSESETNAIIGAISQLVGK